MRAWGSPQRGCAGAIASCLLACAPVVSGENDLDGLLDSVVRAYGGADAIARMEALRVDGLVRAHVTRRRGQVRRDIGWPQRLRVTIAYPEQTEVRVLDGDRGWRGDALQQRRTHGVGFLAMVYQFLRSTVPRSVLEHRAKLVFLGERTEDGVRFEVLHLPWSPHLEMRFWIERRSRRVTRVDAALSAGRTKVSFSTRYDDFREVNGLLFPHAEESFAGETHMASTEITAVRFAPQDLGPFEPYSPGP